MKYGQAHTSAAERWVQVFFGLSLGLTPFTLYSMHFYQVILVLAWNMSMPSQPIFAVGTAIIITSGQWVNVIWQKGHIAAAHGRITNICQLAVTMWPPSDTLLWDELTQIHTPNGISTSSAVFAQVTAVSLYFSMGRTFPPKNYPFAWSIWTHLMHGSLGSPRVQQEGQHELTGQSATNFRWDLGAT